MSAAASSRVSLQQGLQKVFNDATNGKAAMSLEMFLKATKARSRFYGERLFEAIDVDRSGDITFEEFLNAMHTLQTRDSKKRIDFIFRMFDIDNDGHISNDELKYVLQASIEESNADLTQENVDSLVESLLNLFDVNQDGQISSEEFYRVMETYPDVLEGLSLDGVFQGSRSDRKAGSGVSKKKKKPGPMDGCMMFIPNVLRWINHNPQRAFTYTAFFAVVLGCFGWRFSRYAHNCRGVNLDQADPVTYITRKQVRETWNDLMAETQIVGHDIDAVDAKYMSFSSSMGKQDPIGCQDSRKRKLLSWTLPIAKGCGQAMKAVFTLILLPVSRNLMTTLRRTFLRFIFRFDDAIEFHKLVGYTGFVLAWTHTICHVMDIIRWTQNRRFIRWSFAFPDDDFNDPEPPTQAELDAGATEWVSYNQLKAIIDEAKAPGFNMVTDERFVLGEDDDGPPSEVPNDDDDDKNFHLIDSEAKPILRQAMLGGFDVEEFNESSIKLNQQIFRNGVPRYFFRDTSSQPTVGELIASWVGVTGVCLIGIFTIAAFFAFDYPRKFRVFMEKPNERGKKMPGYRGMVLAFGRFINNFNYFWYTHHLFIGFYVAMLMHPEPASPGERREWNVSDAYLWVGVPVIIYLTERLVRFSRTKNNTRLLAADLLPGNVVGIKVLKPKGLKYTAGQYVFIRVPELSWFEWHPFTLTSSPGDNFLSVHVRAAGDWTRELYRMVHAYHKSKGEQNIDDQLTANTRLAIRAVAAPTQIVTERFPFRVFVDGPFGAPAQDHKDYKVMLLVGAGIGVTPMASVLNDILDRMKHHKEKRIEKAYFYWTVRLRTESIWFKHLLEAISQEDEENVLDINIHVTSIKQQKDVRVMLLRIAQETRARAGEGDVVSGLKTRAVTHFGRPDWDTIFSMVKRSHPEQKKIGVFYCGPNPLAAVLAKQIKKHSDSSVRFDFMKESFG